MGFGIKELVVILIIVALLFGTKKLRSIGGDLGGALKGFKKAMSDDAEEVPSPIDEKKGPVDNTLDATEDKKTIDK
jgi:sec-independent protein translocase protein TatA